MEENMIFETYFELPDGYQVQLMVLRDYPGGRARRNLRMSVFRSRVWIGHVTEADPLMHRSQEHADVQVAVDACYSMLLTAARCTIDSPEALAELQSRVDDHFRRATQQVG